VFSPLPVVRRQIAIMISDKEEQGYEVDGLAAEHERTADDHSALYRLAATVDSAPLRADWPYVEPSGWAEIATERSIDPQAPDVDPEDAARRAAAGFHGSVAGCVLGKPVEIMADLDELRSALSAIGEWPLRSYIPEAIHSVGGLRELHPSWTESVRERLRWVPPDDDINYTVLGMMVIEEFGTAFTKAELRRLWVDNLPLGYTWGPERTFLTKQALLMGLGDDPETDLEALPASWNPGSELCGAMIRADAYGYAAPGRPDVASELAWRDASLTHRGNGIYGSMFAAALIAAAFTTTDWRVLAETALSCIPARSRLAEIVADSIDRVAGAGSWLEGYESIHDRYRAYGHCRVFQETGTLINTLRFAERVDHGICLQVSQGNDTDSYGATSGAILGVRFGPGHLGPEWIEPFHDVLHTRVAGFWESSLSATAERIGDLARTGARPRAGQR
jgi:hypothetical protein